MRGNSLSQRNQSLVSQSRQKKSLPKQETVKQNLLKIQQLNSAVNIPQPVYPHQNMLIFNAQVNGDMLNTINMNINTQLKRTANLC